MLLQEITFSLFFYEERKRMKVKCEKRVEFMSVIDQRIINLTRKRERKGERGWKRL